MTYDTKDAKIERLEAELSRLQLIHDKWGMLSSKWEACAAKLRETEEENMRLREAIGLATTAVPDMQMDPNDPISMMRQVVARIAALERAAQNALKHQDDPQDWVEKLWDAVHPNPLDAEGHVAEVQESRDEWDRD
jgi:hypothetical protein